MRGYEDPLCRLLAGRPPPVDAGMHFKRNEGCVYHLWDACGYLYIYIVYVYMYTYIQIWINMMTIDVMRDSLIGVLNGR